MEIININSHENLEKFQDNKNNKNKPLMMRFYSDGCGHCIAMKDEWNNFLNKVKINMKNNKLLVVDVESNYLNELDSNITKHVRGFPTIFFVNNGKIVEFSGKRDSSSMYSFLVKNLKNLKNNKVRTDGSKKIKKKSIKRLKRNILKRHKKTKKLY